MSNKCYYSVSVTKSHHPFTPTTGKPRGEVALWQRVRNTTHIPIPKAVAFRFAQQRKRDWVRVDLDDAHVRIIG